MYSMKLFLSVLLPCLNACAPSQAMLYLVNPGRPVSEAQEVSSSSAISSQLRAMAAKGQLGNNPGSVGFREQIKRLYESANFVPLWIKGDQLTSQATYLIETLRASRLKGLNPSDYDAESLSTKSRSLKGASAAAEASFDATLTQSTMRYISDLRIGRVNPKHLKIDIDVQAKKYDLPEFIAQQVVRAADVQSVLDQMSHHTLATPATR